MRVLQKRRLTESKAEQPKMEEPEPEDDEEDGGGGACGGICGCCGCGVNKDKTKHRKKAFSLFFNLPSSVVASFARSSSFSLI